MVQYGGYIMAISRENQYKDLNLIIKKKGNKVLERFREEIFAGIKNPELILILEEVKSYWRDTFRPALTQLSCEAVGGQSGIAEDAGLVFALAAAGAGIHDDIVDKSSNKHFKKTIHGLCGIDKTLIVGDLLISKAWTIINRILRRVGQPVKIADIIEIYGQCSINMCEAEIMEILCRKKLDTDLEFYKEILWNLNADMQGCAKIGAILGNGSDKEIQNLSDIGRILGFLFAVRTDIKDSLNIEGNILHRLKYESIPLPILFSAQTSKERKNEIKSIIQKKNIPISDIRKVLETCFDTEAFLYVDNLAKEASEEAMSKLYAIQPSLARDLLQQIIEKSYRYISELSNLAF